jgi:hypothetical protein
MKAIVNIGFRSVELVYTIKAKDLIKFSQEEKNLTFKTWELYQKDKNSNIVCKHTIFFDDSDEWKSVLLFDGRTIDFHYDYENRKEFDNNKNWGNYVFQGYEYTDGKPQLYDNNIVTKVQIIY